MAVERIYLARHGQSESNRERRLCGQQDPALSEVGLQQSHQLACVLADVPLAAVFSSKGLLGWSTERVLKEKLRNHFVYEIDVAARAVLRTVSLREEDAGAVYDGFRT